MYLEVVRLGPLSKLMRVTVPRSVIPINELLDLVVDNSSSACVTVIAYSLIVSIESVIHLAYPSIRPSLTVSNPGSLGAERNCYCTGY
jgi:hypothetical protein